MMYHAFPASPTANALSGLGFCVVLNNDGSCAIEGPDTTTGSGEGGTSEGSGIPGSTTPYESPNYPTSTYSLNTYGPLSGGSQPSGNPSSGFNWGFLAPLASVAANVFGTRYAVPQLNPGQTIQTGPGGTLMTQQPAGLPATGGLLTGSTGISTNTLLMFGGIGLVAVLLMRHK